MTHKDWFRVALGVSLFNLAVFGTGQLLDFLPLGGHISGIDSIQNTVLALCLIFTIGLAVDRNQANDN